MRNPFRYRGYFYDHETGFYHCGTRFYDPDIGRWINADSLLNQESVLGYNMFAYCENNPINRADPTGMLWNDFVSFCEELGKSCVTGAVLLFVCLTSDSLLFVSKEKHYSRNDNNTTDIKTIDQVPNDWTNSNTEKYPNRDQGAASNAHQATAPSVDKPNTKFSSPDKHEEVFFSYDEVLVTDPVDVGTYNYGTNVITHWGDIVPWIWWGNSVDDQSNIWGRSKILIWGEN